MAEKKKKGRPPKYILDKDGKEIVGLSYNKSNKMYYVSGSKPRKYICFGYEHDKETAIAIYQKLLQDNQIKSEDFYKYQEIYSKALELLNGGFFDNNIDDRITKLINEGFFENELVDPISGLDIKKKINIRDFFEQKSKELLSSNLKPEEHLLHIFKQALKFELLCHLACFKTTDTKEETPQRLYLKSFLQKIDSHINIFNIKLKYYIKQILRDTLENEIDERILHWQKINNVEFAELSKKIIFSKSVDEIMADIDWGNLTINQILVLFIEYITPEKLKYPYDYYISIIQFTSFCFGEYVINRSTQTRQSIATFKHLSELLNGSDLNKYYDAHFAYQKLPIKIRFDILGHIFKFAQSRNIRGAETLFDMILGEYEKLKTE